MKAKKILSALLTGALILGAVSFTALADDGLITEIKTAEDLVAFAESVNAGNSYAGKTVTLTDNIDLQGAYWEPIGTKKMFQGTFDGGEHEISNFKVVQANMYGNGFFSNTSGATIKNLTISDALVAGFNGSYWGNVYGILTAYTYGTTNIENVHVKDSTIWGYGKVSAIIGMAADPNGVTTVKDCSVDNVTINAVYDVAPFIGLAQNKVAFENNTLGKVTWNADPNEKYLSINDATEKDGETLNVRGTFWLVNGKYLYNGWADYYTDFTFGYEEYALNGNPKMYAVDGLLHNQYEAKIGDIYYETIEEAIAAADSGDVIEGIYFAPNSSDIKGLGAGLYGVIDGMNCEVLSIVESLTNENLTDSEKVELINAIDFEKQEDEVVDAATDIIKALPVDTKESISSASISAIADKSAEALIAHDDANAPTITAKSIAAGVNDLVVSKLDESETLQQPESVNAIYFDVTLKDTDGNAIKEVDVPVHVTVVADDAYGVEKIIRYHDGVVSEIPFEVIDETHIGFTVAKFSEFALIAGQDVPEGSAVLEFREVEAPEEFTAKYDLYISCEADHYTKSVVRFFESGEFAFSMTGTSTPEFTAVDGLEIVYEDVAGKYRVNRTAEKADTAPASSVSGNTFSVKLGTLTLTGVGKGSFSTSDIKMYRKIKADSLVMEIPTLPSAVVNYNIEPAKADLTINVTFPNNIVNQKTLYQDMTVAIKGGEVDETYKLGSDASNVVAWDETNNAYTLTISDKLVANTAYTVTVSGAGYRTARYTVTMTADKTLNFWNNVKDTPAVVEEGSSTGAKSVTFLAGDIVKDGKINIYDLSAVVSYFGTVNNVNVASEYAKYDLNRDGKIDSKDVAYVLVSWGK